jgi:hypothetical protein
MDRDFKRGTKMLDFDPPPFGHIERQLRHWIVIVCDRSIERGKGGEEVTIAGRQRTG